MNIWQFFRSIAVSKSIMAILFVFRRGKNADRAALNACTGWVRYMGRFHERGTYEFTLDAQLSEGNVEVTLLDKKKRRLMKLNPWFPTQKMELDAESRYYLRWDFKRATGTCALRWQPVPFPLE